MIVYHRGDWTFQIYYPQYTRLKAGFNIALGTALTVTKTCFGFQVFGFGFGVGYYGK